MQPTNSEIGHSSGLGRLGCWSPSPWAHCTLASTKRQAVTRGMCAFGSSSCRGCSSSSSSSGLVKYPDAPAAYASTMSSSRSEWVKTTNGIRWRLGSSLSLASSSRPPHLSRLRHEKMTSGRGASSCARRLAGSLDFGLYCRVVLHELLDGTLRGRPKHWLEYLSGKSTGM